jgi:hypothetical protein
MTWRIGQVDENGCMCDRHHKILPYKLLASALGCYDEFTADDECAETSIYIDALKAFEDMGTSNHHPR